MQTILDIIDDALKRKGLSAAAASQMAVGNASLIKNMRAGDVHGKRFNSTALSRLAVVLDLEFYFGEARAPHSPTLPAQSETASARREAIEMGFVPIPYHPAAAPDFSGTAPVALSRIWLEASDFDTQNLSFLPVVSDEMVPTLTIGALAMIDTNQTGADGPGIWAYKTQGRYGFARIERPSRDIVVLNADNSDQVVQILEGAAAQALTILGLVVWIAHQP